MDHQEIRKTLMRYINCKKPIIQLKFPISNKVTKTSKEELVDLLKLDMYKNFYSIERLDIKKRRLSLFIDRILIVPFLVSGTWFCLPNSYLSKYNIYIHIRAINLNVNLKPNYIGKWKPFQSMSLENEKRSPPVLSLECLEYSLDFQKSFLGQPWYVENQCLDYKKEPLVQTQLVK